MSAAVTRGTLVIDTALCKGCELCVVACPPQVLSMGTTVNERGHRYPELHPGCTGCQACQLVCPDFCIAVYKYDQPLVGDGTIGDDGDRLRG